MAKNDGVNADMNAVAKGQRTACELWSPDPTKRQKQIEAYRKAKEAEDAAVREAKEAAKEAHRADALKDDLIKRNGWNKVALGCYTKVAGVSDVEERSRCARQLFEAFKDAGFLVPELFDEAGFGVGTADVKGETAGFDRTSEGQRRGGAKAEPRTTAEMAASHQPPGTGPVLSSEEIIRRFEEANAAYLAKGGKGRRPKALVEAKEAYDALNAQGAAPQEGEAAPVEPPAPPPEAKAPPIEKLPTAEPGQVSAEIKAGVAESEAVLAEQVAASAAAREAKGPKPRARKKVEAAPPAPPPPPAAADDDEDDSFPTATPPAPPPPIGNQPLTGRVG